MSIGSTSTWVEKLSSSTWAKTRLFCLHYAGGSSAAFRTWPQFLPHIEVFGVDLPGRGRLFSQRAHTSIDTLIPALAEQLLPYLHEKPFAFFGHSMGALVSYEFSRYLQSYTQLQPQALFVSGRRSPSYAPHTNFYQLDEQQLRTHLQDLGGTPKEVLENPELMELMLPIIRADFEVCETYQHQAGPLLDCPIYALGGISDRDVQEQHLSAWQQQTSNSCTVQMFVGDHFYLRPAEAQLLNCIASGLQETQQRVELAR